MLSLARLRWPPVSVGALVLLRASARQGGDAARRCHEPPCASRRCKTDGENVMTERVRDVNVKRVYEQPADADGTRVLVDRVWPRGLTKQRAAVDVWLKDIAPSAGLRKWFGHDPSRWKEFEARYRDELAENGAAVDGLREVIHKGP